jgi:hypothetical protein
MSGGRRDIRRIELASYGGHELPRIILSSTLLKRREGARQIFGGLAGEIGCRVQHADAIGTVTAPAPCSSAGISRSQAAPIPAKKERRVTLFIPCLPSLSPAVITTHALQ